MFTLALCFGFVSCSQDDDDNPIAADPDIQLVQHPSLGNILADETGLTLYFFSEDVGGEATCTDGCLANWPVFYVANPEVGNGVDKGRFGVITRTDGTQQSTFDGWPLYYFGGDGGQRGINKGVSVPQPGVWPILNSNSTNL